MKKLLILLVIGILLFTKSFSQVGEEIEYIVCESVGEF